MNVHFQSTLFITVLVFSRLPAITAICSQKISSIIFSSPFDPLIYLTTPSDSSTDISNCSLPIVNQVSKVIRIDVLTFSLGGQDPCSQYDERLEIQFEKSYGSVNTIIWCGQSYGQTLETRENILMTYYRGQHQKGSGFNISVSVVSSVCSNSPRQVLVGPEPVYIYSPGYPDVYDVNIQCQWNLVSASGWDIFMETLKFQLENYADCRYDYLALDNSKFCGDQRIQTTSHTERATLIFKSDHLSVYDGFVVRLTEKPANSDVQCNMTVQVTTAPTTLHLRPLQPGILNFFNCWWRLDSGSDSSVVILDVSQFTSSANCFEFQMKVHDGSDESSTVIVQDCSPAQPFQTIRSSGEFLFIDIDVTGVSGLKQMSINFIAHSSVRDAPPRVLYAGIAQSFIWMDLSSFTGPGLLLRGSEDDDSNYTVCLNLTIVENLLSRKALNISSIVFAYSGVNDSFNELGTGCDRKNSERVVSRGSKIFLKLRQTSSSLLSGNVWFIYNLQRNCHPDFVPLQSSSSGQLISTFSSPYGDHLNNVFCPWLIKPVSPEYYVQVEVLQSQLNSHCDYDNVTAYDYNTTSSETSWITTWCNNERPVVVSSRGNSLLVEFISDARFTTKGFQLSYSSISLENECPSVAKSLIADDTNQTLTSPNFPFTYPNNVDCMWHIVAESGVVKILLLNISISQRTSYCLNGDDYLVIYDGPSSSSTILANLCGNNFIKSTYTSSSSSVLLHFHSDSRSTATGFRLNYTNTATQGCDKDVVLIPDLPTTVTTPNYPNSYPNNIHCSWRVFAQKDFIITMTVLDIQLPGCQDSASVYDGNSENSRLLGKICQYGTPKFYVTTGPNMYITFSSQTSASNYKGFLLNIVSKPDIMRCDGQVMNVYAYPTVNNITSPNYPNNYKPNTECLWHIQAMNFNHSVQLIINDLNLESSYACNFDSLSIYDGSDDSGTLLGKICTTTPGRTFWSLGPDMFLKFTSDSSRELSGFKLSYSSSSEYYTSTEKGFTESSSGTDTGTVVGGILGAACFLVLANGVFFCSLKHIKRRRSPEPPRTRRPSHRTSVENGNAVFFMSPVIVNQMTPPPYPGVANLGYTPDDLPPTYQDAYAPPSYQDLEAPPPYVENMWLSHPPSAPTYISNLATSAISQHFVSQQQTEAGMSSQNNVPSQNTNHCGRPKLPSHLRHTGLVKDGRESVLNPKVSGANPVQAGSAEEIIGSTSQTSPQRLSRETTV